MGHTLAEKIIMKHIGGKDVKPGDDAVAALGLRDAVVEFEITLAVKA